jgi:hypothetical protein
MDKKGKGSRRATITFNETALCGYQFTVGIFLTLHKGHVILDQLHADH